MTRRIGVALLAKGRAVSFPRCVSPARAGGHRPDACDRSRTTRLRRLRGHNTAACAPGILLRIGLGGFADGIALHQILQWHHMLSSEGSYPKTTIAGLEDNTLADGTFHAATWVITVVGLWILWRRTNEWHGGASGHALVG